MRPLRRVFLESTALFQLGPRLENANLSRLLEVRESAPFEIMIAEVSWMEYMRDRKREALGHLEKLRQISNGLEKHGVTLEEVHQSEQGLSKYLAGIDDHFRRRAEANGIKIIPLPTNISLNRILEMSINCTPPFESAENKSEKGFRDSLIMFTVLESIRGRSEDYTVLVSNDGLLSEGVRMHAAEFDANLDVITDLDTAAQLAEDGMDKQRRDSLRREAEEAKRVLNKFRDQMSAYVAEIRELSDADLGQSSLLWTRDEKAGVIYPTLARNPDKYVEIQRLDSVSFDRVITGVWKKKEATTATILFFIRCTAQVTARAPYLASYSSEKKYTVGSTVAQSGYIVSLGPGPSESREMEFFLYGEAQLERAQDSQWALASLRVDRSPPSEEDTQKMIEVELAEHAETDDGTD
jgi:hypothetical protein